MSTAMTFASLCADAAKYMERGSSSDTDVNDKLPSFVNMAERRIAVDLKVQGMLEVVVTEMVAGKAVYPKPDRWRDTVSMNFGTGNARRPLLTRSYEYVRNFWPDDSLTGAPRFYADYNDANWIIAPTPATNYPLEILYHQMHRLLDDTHQTNWITEHQPRMLLYATLCEIALFTRSFDTLQTWEGKYKEALGAINGEDMKKMVDRSATRQGA